jgi:hypothetical protein
VHRADELVVLAGQLAQGRADAQELLFATLARLLDRGPRLGGQLERGLEAGQDEPGTDQDRLGGPTLAGDPLAALDLAGPGLALGLGSAPQLVGTTVQRTGPLLGGAQRQPRVGLVGACLASQLDQLLTRVQLGLGARVGLRTGQAALELGEPGLVLLTGRLGLLDRPGQPVRLGPGVANEGAELSQLLGHSGQRGVRLVQLGQGDVDALLGVVPLVLEPRDVEGQPL